MNLTNIALRGLNWRGGLAMLGFAALLPLMPTWARAQQPGAEKKGAIELKLENVQLSFDNSDAEKAKADLEKLKAELKKKQAEVADLEARLKAAAGHGGKVEAKRPEAGKALQFELQLGEGQLVFGEPKKAPPAPAKPGVMMLQLGDGKVIELQMEGLNFLTSPGKVEVAPAKPAPAKAAVLYELVPGEKGTYIFRPVSPPAKPGHGKAEIWLEGPGLKGIVVPAEKKVEGLRVQVNPGPAKAGADKRVEDAEKRINELINELEKLKRELRTKPAPEKGKEQGKIERPMQFRLEGEALSVDVQSLNQALEFLRTYDSK